MTPQEFLIREPVPPDPPASLAGEPDEELLGYIPLLRESDPEEAGRAYKELHRRHADFVADRLGRQFGGPVASDELDDVTQELFTDLYLRLADRYKPQAGAALTRSQQRHRVRAWLCRIAHRRVLDLLRSTKDRVIESLDAEDAPEPGQSVQAPDSEVTTRIYEIMNEVLDERERIVLRWTHRQWYDPNDGQLHAGHGGAAALAACWKTTVSNIRKIRERALDKLIPALRAAFPTLAATEPSR